MKTSINSDLFKNGFLLIGSNALGQALSFLIYPVLTRIYSTEDFGIFASFLSITGLLSILSTGKFEDALLLTKNAKETSYLLGFIVKLLTTFCIILLISLIAFEIPYLSPINKITGYWYLIPLTVFSSGLFQLLGSLANSKKEYSSIASSNILLNGSSSALKILFAYITPTGIGLITSNIIGQFFACFSFYKLKNDLLKVFQNRWAAEKNTGIKYKVFPIFNMTKNFVNTFSGNLPFLVLGFFGETYIGLFSLAMTSVFRPINLVSNSFYKIFFQKSAQAIHHKEKILPILKEFIQKTILFILPFFILAFFIANPLFKFIFGDNWEEAGTYFKLILPWMFMVFLTNPISFIPVIFEKQKTALYIEILYLICRAGALYIGIYFTSFKLAIFLFSLVGFAFISIMFTWYLLLIISYEKQLTND